MIQNIVTTMVELVEDLKISLEKIREKSKIYFKEAQEKMISNVEEKSRSYRVEVKREGVLGWFKDIFTTKYEDRTETYTVIRTGAVRTILEDLTFELEDRISIEIKDIMRSWRKSLYSIFVKTLRKSLGDKYIDYDYLTRTLKSIVNSLNMLDIVYSGALPSELKKSGTIERYEADRFLEKANDFISNLRIRVRNDINNYIKQLEKSLLKENFGKRFFKKYDEKLKQLEEQINNKELTIERFKRILKSLEELK